MATKTSKNAPNSFSQAELVAIFLLVLLYPIGLIVMWYWSLWSKPIRWLISVPALFFLLMFLLALTVGTWNLTY